MLINNWETLRDSERLLQFVNMPQAHTGRAIRPSPWSTYRENNQSTNPVVPSIHTSTAQYPSKPWAGQAIVIPDDEERACHQPPPRPAASFNGQTQSGSEDSPYQLSDNEGEDGDGDFVMRDDNDVVQSIEASEQRPRGSDEVEWISRTDSLHISQVVPGDRLDPTIDSDVELTDGTFMRVTASETDAFGKEWIRGLRLYQQTSRKLLMPPVERELVWVSYFVDSAGTRKSVDREPKSALRRRCTIVFTNLSYTRLNFNHLIPSECGAPQVYFCRWKRTLSAEEKINRVLVNRQRMGKVERLKYHEVDEVQLQTQTGAQMTRIHDRQIRRTWRGPEHATCVGGSAIEEVQDGLWVQKYTIGDAFCGAGGTMQGAVDAGLAARWAIDHNQSAIQTYKNNLQRPGLEVHCLGIDKFVPIAQSSGQHIVDILHLSPPCQPFSPANTTPNAENDAENQATFLAIEDVIRACKPRVITLEETEGLLYRKHRQWFQKLICLFVDSGYSVHWRSLELKNYGVPQSRKRLIIIAAGPGEKLPSFPAPTHGFGPGLLPLPTIAGAISNIPFHPVHHNPRGWFDPPRTPFNANDVSGTITCGGGSKHVYHPSGLRAYTPHELAALQTFPRGYRFVGPDKNSVTRQIGNAVPPAFARALFESVRRELEEADSE